jgi:hypothetical protein
MYLPNYLLLIILCTYVPTLLFRAASDIFGDFHYLLFSDILKSISEREIKEERHTKKRENKRAEAIE